MPPGVTHRAVVRSGDTPYRRFVFWLSEGFCEALRAESADQLYLFDRVRAKKEYVYPMDPLESNSLRSKLFRILEELYTDRFGRDALIGLCVRELLLMLGRIVWQRQNACSKEKAVSSFQAVTDYIASHLDGDLSLDDLSRALFLSKFYISHLIQENTGLSLHRYITKKRLAACVDAMQGGEKITDCCARSGFLNYSSFYRAFLKEYKCSPTVYLQERLSSAEAEEQFSE